jgi:transcriptional regulator with XRE-family HTH domain
MTTIPTGATPESELSIEDIARSLRAIRRQKGWTLKMVESISGGRWKAVVVGSYERCDRALSLNKAVALAAFYQVPLEVLLGIETSEGNPPYQRSLTLKIAHLHESASNVPEMRSFQNFILWLCATRRDWNGQVITLRRSDATTLALILNRSEESLYLWLVENKFLE